MLSPINQEAFANTHYWKEDYGSLAGELEDLDETPIPSSSFRPKTKTERGEPIDSAVFLRSTPKALSFEDGSTSSMKMREKQAISEPGETDATFRSHRFWTNDAAHLYSVDDLEDL